MSLCINIDLSFEYLKDLKVYELTIYATELRYPEFFYIPSLKEAQTAVEIAEKTRDFVVRRKVSPYSLVCRRRFVLVKRAGSRSQNPNYATNNFFQLLNFKMTSAIKYQLRIGSKQPVGTNTAFALLVLHFRNLGRQV